MPHVQNIEIQEESQRETGQFEVRQQLSAMDGKDSFYAFQLENQTLFDDVIDAERSGKLNAFIDDRKMNLVLELKARFDEFVVEACVARAFQHSRAKRCVNLHRRVDHAPGDFIGSH